MSVSTMLDAAHAQIEANWNYSTIEEAQAYRKACQLLIAVRGQQMSKGGGTQEEMRFDHATLQRMLNDVKRWIAANRIAGNNLRKISSRCWRP